MKSLFAALLILLPLLPATLSAQGVTSLRTHVEPGFPEASNTNDADTAANASFNEAYGFEPGEVSIGVDPNGGNGDDWVVVFSGTSSTLTTGTYNRDASMDVETDPYNAPTGTFVVHEITFDSSNSLVSAWVTFVEYISPSNSALYGDFRYNADTDASAGPIVDAGPDQSVQGGVAALNGKAWIFTGKNGGRNPATEWSVVSGPGPVKFRDATLATTTAAITIPGTYVLRLTGREGKLANSADVTVTYSDRCTSLYVVDGGQVTFDTPADGAITAESIYGDIDILVGYDFYLKFIPPAGSSLATGTYANAQFNLESSGTAAGVVYSGLGETPLTTTGSFVIKELTLDGSNNITSFWATFTEYPNGSPTPVTGEVRINADSAGTIIPGTYEGLTSSNQYQAGAAKITLNASGAFTGYFDGDQSWHHVISGAISPASSTWSGLASTNAATGILNTTLQFNSDGTLCGAVHDDENLATLFILKPVAQKGAFPSLTGKYTMALTPGDNFSDLSSWGYGIGYATVESSGAVRFVGALPDGRNVTCGLPLASDGSVPYLQPFLGYGSVGGWVQFADLPDSDFSGTLSWNYSNPQHPYGLQIATTLSLAGCRWNGGLLLPGASSTYPNAQAVLTNPNWTSPITLNLDVGTTVAAPGQGVRNVTQRPGLWAGAIKDPGEYSAGVDAFATVFLQKQNKGYGLFRLYSIYVANPPGTDADYYPVTITPAP